MATFLGCTISKHVFCLIEEFELELTTVVNMACFVINLATLHDCLTYDKKLTSLDRSFCLANLAL